MGARRFADPEGYGVLAVETNWRGGPVQSAPVSPSRDKQLDEHGATAKESGECLKGWQLPGCRQSGAVTTKEKLE